MTDETETQTDTGEANPAQTTESNPAPNTTENGQDQQGSNAERVAELEHKLEEAKRQLADSTARIERALGR
jgi:molecular chaperone GrpE (heat shock protein)